MSDDSVPLAKAVELWRRQNARLADLVTALEGLVIEHRVRAAWNRVYPCCPMVSATQYEADRRASERP